MGSKYSKTLYSENKIVKLSIVLDKEWETYIVIWQELRKGIWEENPDKSYEAGGLEPEHLRDAILTRESMLKHYNEFRN